MSAKARAQHNARVMDPDHVELVVLLPPAPEEQRSRLFNYVMNRNSTDFRVFYDQLIRHPEVRLTDPEFRDPITRATLLHVALIGESWDIGKHIIQTTADLDLLTDMINYRQEPGRLNFLNAVDNLTCLHILAAHGNHALAALLLKKLAIVPVRRKQLLESKVSAHLNDDDEFLSIHVAAFYGHSEFVELLLDNGVDVNSSSRDNGDTPVMLALHGYIPRNSSSGIAATVTLLRKRGADFRLKNKFNEMPWIIALKSGVALVRLAVEQCRFDVNESIEVRKCFRGMVNSTPLVFATQLGLVEVVQYLLENEVKVKAKVYQGWTALHEASRRGYEQIVGLLLTRDAAIVDDVDSWGRTPLMIAAQNSRLGTMRLLMSQYGASTDRVTQDGRSFWDFILDGDDELLDRAIQLYRDVNEQPAGNITFRPACSPLHAAVGRIDADNKIRRLVVLGADLTTKDDDGNTFYHVAARNNDVDVLRVEAFLRNRQLVESKNKNGDTPLHLAAKFGKIDAVGILIDVWVLFDVTTNAQQQTVLHQAVQSGVPDVVRAVVDILKQRVQFPACQVYLDAIDDGGNTALHLAVRRGQFDVIETLTDLNAYIYNMNGDIPLHVAARTVCEINIERLFRHLAQHNTTMPPPTRACDWSPRTGALPAAMGIMDVNEQNWRTGDTVLHISAQSGRWHRVEQLINVRADLAAQNLQGNTALHLAVQELVRRPAMATSLLQVFHVIVSRTPEWWSHKYDCGLEDDVTRKAVIRLTSEIKNNDSLSVIGLAVELGAAQIIDELFNLENVYRFSTDGEVAYDVTNLVPDTKLDPADKIKSCMEHMVKSIEGSNRGNKQNEMICSKIMNCIPFTLLLENYRASYRSLCVLLMLLHFIQMCLYSCVALPRIIEMTRLFNKTYGDYGDVNGSTATIASEVRAEMTTHLPLSPVWIDAFLLWPVVLLISVLYLWISSFAKVLCTLPHCSCPSRPVRMLKQFFVVFTEHFRLLSTTAYTMASIVVHFLLRYGTTPHTLIECAAVAVLLGWLVILHFARGTNDLIFASMVKRIVLRDISRFLFMYLCILFGFGFAMHALFQLSPALADEFVLPSDAIFALFNMLLGIDAQFETVYKTKVEKSPLVYAVYVFYIFLASVLLINLLVAMMTNTYDERRKIASQDWRIGSLKVCFRIEQSCSPLGRLRARFALYRLVFHKQFRRYMMHVPLTVDEPIKKRIKKSMMYQTMLRVEYNVNRLQAEVNQMIAPRVVRTTNDGTNSERDRVFLQ